MSLNEKLLKKPEIESYWRSVKFTIQKLCFTQHVKMPTAYERKKKLRHARDKLYRDKNHDILKQRRKCYNDENRELVAKKRKSYHAQNRTNLTAKHEAFNEKNKTVIKAKNALYYVSNQEHIKVKQSLYNAVNRKEISARQSLYDSRNRAKILTNKSRYNRNNRCFLSLYNPRYIKIYFRMTCLNLRITSSSRARHIFCIEVNHVSYNYGLRVMSWLMTPSQDLNCGAQNKLTSYSMMQTYRLWAIYIAHVSGHLSMLNMECGVAYVGFENYL